ncbi:hypothetical protein [Helicobacter kayseriensis]|uniref:F0F1 ATP synthase subunit B family protein n=1 Tax=Helicobacter kayseriensis TaxID=2905877 RepID=UPI001E58145C|nr:hypothetical protein [Helicobacter kayseriensis]MCE3048448.1 hypothetical protein [Helicobacter kayseriensis]
MRSIFVWGFFFSVLSAADVSLAQSDFVERVINFVIFALIIWYLGSSRIKQIFTQRKMKIVHEFDKLQEEEKEMKKIVEKTENLLADAQNKAKEIVGNAKKEAFVIAQQFDSDLERDIKTVASSFDERLKQERKKMLCDEVASTIDQSLQKVRISQDSCMEILTKGIR